MSKRKQCGNCINFIKIVSLKGSSGLCNAFDCRVDAGKYKADCHRYSPIKYIRKK